MLPLSFLGVLGVLLIGYLLLDGYFFGVGLALWHVGRGQAQRRLLLNAVGPYFLGNEVWIVAAAGVLFGGFPDLEGSLLAGFYPLIVLVIGALVLRDAGMWLRSRRDSGRWRRGWDGLIGLASLGLASGWGLILGTVVQGIPAGHAASAGAGPFDPYPLLCGATFVALVACHGAVFLAMRTQGAVAARSARLATRLTAPVGVLLAATVGLGFASGPVRAAIDQPVAAVAVALAALVALLGARHFLAAGRYGQAFACTAASVASPVIAVGIGMAPTLLSMAGAPDTLGLLGGFLIVVAPVMAAGQIWLWRAFRGPVGPASPMYF